ncbi:MAG TPA: neutral/alkaline non-lysosomal ceramidase N-terminal domain-containing protein [Spirochaetia bacterium]|nr:neutral/alkaline non-lysosomal ceramidase N-terminal domain-containing protein [Spirochaetia bacterium]
MARGMGLEAGVAQVDISPPAGVQLVGYPTVIRDNTGIHDPLFADCLVLSDGTTRLALVTADLVGVSKDFMARLRLAVQADTGIPGSNLMLACSHTHGGPRTAAYVFEEEKAMGGRVESAYVDGLLHKLRDVVKKAATGMGPARLGFGRGRAGAEKGIGGNRHHPSGICDPAVGVIGVQDQAGALKALLVKYSLHPTILQMDNRMVTADYPWGIRTLMGERHPEATFFFAQGTTGDQSSRYFRKDQTFAEAERFGRIIGEEADRVLGTLAWTRDVKLGSASEQVEPAWKEIPPIPELEARIARYWEQLHQLEARGAPYVEQQTCYLDRLGTELTLGMARARASGARAPWEHDAPLEVHCLRLGDACVVGYQGEVFAEYTLATEKLSPFDHTYIFTLANGIGPGYVVDQASADKGLFEYGASMMKPETGGRIVDAAARLMRRLKE